MNRHSWTLVTELPGGEAQLQAVIEDFYDALFEDVMVGFFFLPHDKATLVRHQMSYVRATLGKPDAAYTGRPMRRAHEHLPILGAHFDRRHQILAQTLVAHQVPEHVRLAWLEFDLKLRPLIVRTGHKERNARLGEQE